MSKQRFILLDDQRKANAHTFMDSLPADGKYEVIFQPYSKPRSAKINRALYGVAYPPFVEYMREMGDDSPNLLDEIHEHFCGEFWGLSSYMVLDKIKQRPFRTTTKDENGKRDVISNAVMCELYEFIQRKGAELGLNIPDPDPLHNRGQ